MVDMTHNITVADVAGTVRIAGRVLARGVSYDDFLAADYGDAHVEWIDGMVIGAANLVVEVVSPSSRRTDMVEKRREYELGGVPEYWILDLEKQAATFLRLIAQGVYEEILPHDGSYASAVLPGFRLDVPTLWRSPLPNITQVIEMVRAMPP
jgi:hypothetical protein